MYNIFSIAVLVLFTSFYSHGASAGGEWAVKAAGETFKKKYGYFPGDIPKKKAQMFGFSKYGNGDGKISSQEATFFIDQLIEVNLLKPEAKKQYSVKPNASKPFSVISK